MAIDMTDVEFTPAPDLTGCPVGSLAVSVDLVADLLGIAPRNEITALRIAGDGQSVELLVRGEDMPPEGHVVTPTSVTILCHSSIENGECLIEASWAHKPERRWRLK
jgi:hypothetical protein